MYLKIVNTVNFVRSKNLQLKINMTDICAYEQFNQNYIAGTSYVLVNEVYKQRKWLYCDKQYMIVINSTIMNWTKRRSFYGLNVIINSNEILSEKTNLKQFFV